MLVLSGGLTVHNLSDRGSLAPASARPLHHAFNDAVTAAITLQDVSSSPSAPPLLPFPLPRCARARTPLTTQPAPT